MEKTFKFVEFRASGSRIASDYIGITKNGTISFYSGFVRKYNIQEFTKCTILYDRANGVIGIQFGGDELGVGAYPINFDTGHKMGGIAATNFFKLNPELVSLKGRYRPEKYDDLERNNVYLIDLRAKVE